MTRTLERRAQAGVFELRADAGAGRVLTGYAITYNSLSQNLGGFVEQVAPGAADKSIADQVRVLARYNHDDAYLLGTTDAGTLRLEADGTGVRYDVDLPDTTAGRDVAVLAARGDLRNSSFAFYVPPNGDEWSLTESGFPLRTLRAIQLVDVAPVNSPAYLDSTAGMRSLADRVGLDLDTLAVATVDEVRARLAGEDVPIIGQADSHPMRAHAIAARRLAWANAQQ